jgi:hypothetical protein
MRVARVLFLKTKPIYNPNFQYGKRKAQATPTVKPLVYSNITVRVGGLWLYSCGFNRQLSVNKKLSKLP